MSVMVLANLRNGLAYLPYNDVCYFASCDGHSHSRVHLRPDSMPYRAVIHLLQGGVLRIVDATQHDKPLTDALRYGVPAWCRLFNRARGGSWNHVQVCDWEDRAIRVAANGQEHRWTLRAYRKLIEIFGAMHPAVVSENVILECHRQVDFDDRPELLRQLLAPNAPAAVEVP